MRYPALHCPTCIECGIDLTDRQIADDDSHCQGCIDWLNGED